MTYLSTPHPQNVLLAEQALLGDGDHALDEYRELVKGFDDRLTLGRIRFAERYRDGSLNILVHARLRGSVDFRIVLNRENEARSLRRPEASPKRLGSWGGAADDEVSLGVGGEKGKSPSDGDVHVRRRNGDNPAVFVECVQFVEDEKGPIPSVVRLQPLDETAGLRADAFYFSNRVGLKVLARSADRKPRASSYLTLVISNQVADQVIEGGTQVVHDVPKNGGEGGWQGLSHSDAVDVLASLRVYLVDKFIWLGLVKGCQHRIEFREVLFGPLDL